LRVARSPYAEPELDPADAAAVVLEAATVAGAAKREQAEAELEGVELTSRELEQRLRRVQRGGEREELLASLEELASWYRDLVVVAAGAEETVVHADRLDALRDDANRDRAQDAAAAAELVRDTWRTLEEFNVSSGLALEALFVQLKRAFSSGLPLQNQNTAVP
jgi:DNA polymerase III subunit delta'